MKIVLYYIGKLFIFLGGFFMGNENIETIRTQLKANIIPRKFYSDISFVNSKGKQINFFTSNKNIINAFNLINEELKDKSLFNISDIPNILQKVETTFPPNEAGEYGFKDLNRVMRHAVEDFSKDYSDGGKDITEKEIRQWFERIHACNSK